METRVHQIHFSATNIQQKQIIYVAIGIALFYNGL